MSGFLLPIADVLGKSIVLLAAAALSAGGLSRKSAASRHCVWLAVFVALLLLPFTRLVEPAWSFSFAHPALRMGTPSIVDALPSLPPEVVLARDAKGAPPFPMWPEAGLMLWLCVSELLLGYRLLGGIQLALLLRRSSPAGAGLEELAAAVATEFGGCRAARLRVSVECGVPMTWGMWRPVVLLPAAAAGWSRERLMAALRHEYAHISRRDYLSRGISQVVCALYWPNPLVWLAARRLRAEQEMACDDVVLRRGSSAGDYARQLVEAAQHFIRPPFVRRHTLAMAQRSTLEGRVRSIVDASRDRRPAGRGMIAIVAMGLAAMLVAGAVAQAGGEKHSVPAEKSPAAAAKAKADMIMISKLDLHELTMADAINLLRKRSFEDDVIEADPKQRGVSIFIQLPAPATKITLSLTNVSVTEAASQIAHAAGFELISDDRLNILSLVPAGTSQSTEQRPAPRKETDEERLEARAESIRIPKVGLREATLNDAVDFFVKQSREFDPEPDPQKKGINMVIKREPNAPESRMTLQLTDVSLMEAVRYAAVAVGMEVAVEPNALAIVPKGTLTKVLITREYDVDDGMRAGFKSDGEAKEFLKKSGVIFAPGSSIAFPHNHVVMRNSEEGHKSFAALLENSSSRVVP